MVNIYWTRNTENATWEIWIEFNVTKFYLGVEGKENKLSEMGRLKYIQTSILFAVFKKLFEEYHAKV